MAQRKRKADVQQEQQVAASSDRSVHSGVIAVTAVTLTEIEKKRAISRKSSQRHRLKEKFALEEAQEKKDELLEKNRMVKAENLALREQIRLVKLFKTSGNVHDSKRSAAMAMPALVAPSKKAVPAAAPVAATTSSSLSSAVTPVSRFASLQAASPAPPASSWRHFKERSAQRGSSLQPWPSARLESALQVARGTRHGRPVSPGSSMSSKASSTDHIDRQRLENLLQDAFRIRHRAVGSLHYSSASSTASIGNSSSTSSQNDRQRLESILQDASQGSRPGVGVGVFGSTASVITASVQNDKQRLERAQQEIILGRNSGIGGLSSIRPTGDAYTNALSIEEALRNRDPIRHHGDAYTNALSIEEVLKNRDPQLMQLLENELQALLLGKQDTRTGGTSVQALANILQNVPQDEPCPQRLDLERVLQGMLVQSKNTVCQQAPQVTGNTAASLQDLAKALEKGSCNQMQPQIQTVWRDQRPTQSSIAASQLLTVLLQESLRRGQGSAGFPRQESQIQALPFLPIAAQRGSLSQQAPVAVAQMLRAPVSRADNSSANDLALAALNVIAQQQQRRTTGNANYAGLSSNKRPRIE